MAYTADFTASIVGNLPRLTPVTFTYTGDTTPAVVGYHWDFGDGSTSNEEHPAHFWTSEGAKTVSLTVIFDDGKQDTETKVDFVTITPDDLDDYLDLLLTQFKDKDHIRGLTSPHIDQMAILDHVSESLQSVRSLQSSGVVLDTIGEILGLPRLGRSDADYRLALERMPAIIRGYGQLEVLIEYTQLFLEPLGILAYDGQMRVLLDVTVTSAINADLFLSRVQLLAAAGVRVELIVNEGIPLEFEYTDEPPEFADGNELSEIDGYYDGGILSELL